MANTKSAIKRNKQNEKRRVLNRVYRGRARTFVSKARNVIEKEESKEVVMASVVEAVKALDLAAQKGVIHKNNAARRKSRLMKRLANLPSEEK
ncbi:MAG: 30S ribosomal protein S20 [Anaerolineaceae bacterium]|nr:30S ribosomal protein S20 [Anaerolineaceae bacterium]